MFDGPIARFRHKIGVAWKSTVCAVRRRGGTIPAMIATIGEISRGLGGRRVTSAALVSAFAAGLALSRSAHPGSDVQQEPAYTLVMQS